MSEPRLLLVEDNADGEAAIQSLKLYWLELNQVVPVSGVQDGGR